MTPVGRDVTASDKLELSPLKSRGTYTLLATRALGTMGGGLMGVTGTQDCSGGPSSELDKSFSTSTSMLGPVTILLGHSVTECGEEICIDDH